MATYPYSEDAILVNSIKASTVVLVLEGMEVSTTTFTSALGGETSTVVPLSGPGPVIQNRILGSVPLSPVRSKAVNMSFTIGPQKLLIDLISFRAQFGLDTGQVTCHGKVTDLNGENEVVFAKQIAA